MLPSFTMDSMLRTVRDYRLKEILLVPAIIIRMVRDEKTVSKYGLSSLRRFSSGAAPLSDEILQLLKKKFPQTRFKQVDTECPRAVPVSRRIRRRSAATKYAFRVGTIVASTEVKIVEPDTAVV
jgi:4-coumarate--CoA ligase